MWQQPILPSLVIGSRWFGSSCLRLTVLPPAYPSWPYEVSNEGEEGGNESHERSEGHDQGSAFGWVGHCYWDEEGRHHQSPEHIDWDRHRRGEEVWQVRSPWLVYDQDSPEGSYQRWHSDDVWARDEGQTTASEDCREGISCFSIEESNLRPSWMLIGYAERLMLVAPWGFGAQLVFQRLSLMYTKSPWVLVEIYHHCSFGHSERSDLREKNRLFDVHKFLVQTLI